MQALPPLSRPAAPAAPGPTPLTPATRELVSGALELPLGETTLGAALDSQIRFRVEGDGPPSQRVLVPDTSVAARLIASKAGPDVERMLRATLSAGDEMADRARIHGLILIPDAQAAAASLALTGLQATGPGRLRSDNATAGHALLEAGGFYSGTAGAWHHNGWITMSPLTSRGMLTAAGAYTPAPSETAQLHRAGAWASYLPHITSHEVQHAVSPAGRRPHADWLEEGTAQVLSDMQPARDAMTAAMGVSRHRYAGHLGAPDHIDLGWSAWQDPELSAEQAAAEQQRTTSVYVDSKETIAGLLRLAGTDLSDPGSRPAVQTLLQGKSNLYVPGRIADAIIAHQGLDPSMREPLRRRILAANDSPESLQAVEQFVARHRPAVPPG